MMENIGSIDPELRDDLIYDIFYHWIINGRLTHEQLQYLLEISLDSSHLFYKLYEKDDDAVFKRTFSALIAALIIYEHRKDSFLAEEALYDAKKKLIDYMNNEKDVRGYVEVKGWAHSAAHTSDALDELAQCGCFGKTDLLDILNSIKTKVCIGYYVFVDEESERMVTAVESCLNRRLLSNSEIMDWLKGFRIDAPKDGSIERLHLKVNIKGFLRSLYFRLLETEEYGFIIEQIKGLLSSL